MAAEQIHALSKHRRRGSVARLRPKTVSSNLEPFTVCKVEPIQIVAVMSVIAPKNVQLVVKNHCGMRMAGGRACFRIENFLNLPFILVNREFVKVVNTVETIIAAKDVYVVVVHDSCVSVSG